MRNSGFVGAAAVALAASAGWANVIDISGRGAWGSFGGTLAYTFVSGSIGTLDVSLTNTSPAGNGGYITGFVFNIIDGGAGRSAALDGATHPAFRLVLQENASPFGVFDAGAALGANWQGGGNPAGGIAAGQSGHFSFRITSPNAASLTARSFVGQGEPFQFVVRFRGFAGGQSDKVPVPAPASVAALSLAGLSGRRRRR